MNTLSVIKILLWVLGEAIIIAAFFLLAGDHSHTLWFKLDIVVASFVYTFNALNLNRITYSPGSFDKKIAGLGIAWFSTGIYTVLAIVGIIAGLIWGFPGKIQLIYQAIFFLIYLWGSASSVFSNQFSIQVDSNKEDWVMRHEKLTEGFRKIHSLVSQKTELHGLIRKTNDLIEKADNISLSTLPQASEQENELQKELYLIQKLCQSGTPDVKDISQHLDTCQRLLEERKRLRYK